MTRKELMVEADMLEGNINRMNCGYYDRIFNKGELDLWWQYDVKS
jgi:hypothetical protein